MLARMPVTCDIMPYIGSLKWGHVHEFKAAADLLGFVFRSDYFIGIYISLFTATK